MAERGQNISGGQRQRIALARVFLKGPPILILGEGTGPWTTPASGWCRRGHSSSRRRSSIYRRSSRNASPLLRRSSIRACKCRSSLALNRPIRSLVPSAVRAERAGVMEEMGRVLKPDESVADLVTA
ncbi:MAG: ATP-binding cassette domain-containing protein, partial [Geminicoccaceae bacterium]